VHSPISKFVCLGVALLAFCAAADAKDIAVVVNKSNAVKSVSFADLTRMFKLRTRNWGSGRDILLVVRDPLSPAMKLPLRKLNMTSAEIKDLIASARAHNDALVVMVVPSDEVLVKAVATNPGAIGLVDVYSITSAITVVRVDGKLPLEPGYALHGN
jgi:ABC-type phosphate transport system substrate-binding protein